MTRVESLAVVVAIAALTTFAASGAAIGQSALPAPAAPTVASSAAVELVKALAWPVFALLIAALFRQPIALFVSALGSRITKFSLFKVEIELVPATAATTTPLLDDIRTTTNSATINDSSRMMLEQVQSGTPADFAVISLGSGEEWLTSRLYIAAVMMERMRGVKAFVFVERAPTTERRLVAVASVSQLRWALARRYPWLEAAWARAFLIVFPQAIPLNAPVLPAGAQWLPDPRTMSMPSAVFTSDTGALEPWQARQLVSGFIDSLQQADPVTQVPNAAEWVTVGGKTRERAAWVTRELLASLLPQEAFNRWAHAAPDAPRAQRTRAVLRRGAPFVALVEENREFMRLANRQALLEEMAASLGEEPDESRH